MTDDERLEAIRARMSKTRPGIWKVPPHGNGYSVSDSVFIAHARNDIEWLLNKENKMVSREIKRLRQLMHSQSIEIARLKGLFEGSK